MRNFLLRVIVFIALVFLVNYVYLSIFLNSDNAEKNLKYILETQYSDNLLIDNLEVESIGDVLFKSVSILGGEIWENLYLDGSLKELSVNFDLIDLLLKKNESDVSIGAKDVILEVKYKKNLLLFEHINFEFFKKGNSLEFREVGFKWNNIYVKLEGSISDVDMRVSKNIKQKNIAKKLDVFFGFFKKLEFLKNKESIYLDISFKIVDGNFEELNVRIDSKNFSLLGFDFNSIAAEFLIVDNELSFIPYINITFNEKENLSINLRKGNDDLFLGELRGELLPNRYASYFFPKLDIKNFFSFEQNSLKFSTQLDKLDCSSLMNFYSSIKKNLLISNGIAQSSNFSLFGLSFDWGALEFMLEERKLFVNNIVLQTQGSSIEFDLIYDYKTGNLSFDIKKFTGDINLMRNFLGPNGKVYWDKLWARFLLRSDRQKFVGKLWFEDNFKKFFLKGKADLGKTSYRGLIVDDVGFDLEINDKFVSLNNMKISDKKGEADLDLKFYNKKGDSRLAIDLKKSTFPVKTVLKLFIDDADKFLQRVEIFENDISFKGDISLTDVTRNSLIEGDIFFKNLKIFSFIPIKDLKAKLLYQNSELSINLVDSKIYGGIFKTRVHYNFKQKDLYIDSFIDNIMMRLIPLEQHKFEKGQMSGNLFLYYDFKDNIRVGDGLLDIKGANIWKIPLFSQLFFFLKEYIPSIDSFKAPIVIDNQRVFIKKAETNGKFARLYIDGYINDFTKQLDIDIEVKLFGFFSKLLSWLTYFLTDSRIVGTLDNYIWETKRFFVFEKLFSYRKKDETKKLIY